MVSKSGVKKWQFWTIRYLGFQTVSKRSLVNCPGVVGVPGVYQHGWRWGGGYPGYGCTGTRSITRAPRGMGPGPPSDLTVPHWASLGPHLASFASLGPHLASFGLIGTHFGCIWTHFGCIWTHLDPFWTIYSGIFDPFWTIYSGIFDPFLTFLRFLKKCKIDTFLRFLKKVQNWHFS